MGWPSPISGVDWQIDTGTYDKKEPNLHPKNLTWIPKIAMFKRELPFPRPIILSIYVSCRNNLSHRWTNPPKNSWKQRPAGNSFNHIPYLNGDFFYPIHWTKTSWWFQPIWKNACQIGPFPQNRDEHKQYLKPPLAKLRRKTMVNHRSSV